MAGIELGCGLLALGKKWGTTPNVATESQVRAFLEAAHTSGIRFFDTAPSYGPSSERHLGAFLSSLTAEQRAGVTVATKCGEHWDDISGSTSVNHSQDALKQSIDRSLEYLGNISILQLHKTTPDLVLNNQDVEGAFDYAKQMGIPHVGASVTDIESAVLMIANSRFDVMQIPYNVDNTKFQQSIRVANAVGLTVITNRPFRMGDTMRGAIDPHQTAVDAFRIVLQENFNGVVLTGTSNIDHLQQNQAAFQAAQQGLGRLI